MIEVEKTALPGVVVVTPQVFKDDRGFFLETWSQDQSINAGLPNQFVQDNQSHSSHGVLRGLHYQYPHWQGKLVRAITGKIFDVAVDIRRDSHTYGKWISAILSGENNKQLYVPPGYAHGFCVISDSADVVYKCTSLYRPQEDSGIRWNDPALGINWPIENPLVSAKDQNAPFLCEILAV